MVSNQENRPILSGIYSYLSSCICEKLPLQSSVLFLGVCTGHQYKKFWGQGTATLLLANDFVCVWKTHFEGRGSGADFPGCENLLKHHRPHVIFIWSAAGAERQSEKRTAVWVPAHAVVLWTFWDAASDSLAELLS